jgi:hypothetical protein
MRGISGLAEELLTSQKRLCCMELEHLITILHCHAQVTLLYVRYKDAHSNHKYHVIPVV